MLGATERGLGGCIIGSIDRPELRKMLAIAERYGILLVLAWGKSAETVVLEHVRSDGVSSTIWTRRTCTICPGAFSKR
jgi:hypothetical protein